MARIKGSGMIILKKILANHNIDIEKDLLPRVTPEVAEHFKKTAVAWVEIPKEQKGHDIYESACLINPNNPTEGLKQLGEEMAGLAPWFYKIFFRIQSKEFIFNKFDKIWSSFYDTGQGKCAEIKDDQVTFVVTGYPEFPNFLRQFLSGWFSGFVKTLKLPVTAVNHDDKDPNAWKWTVKWST